MFSNSSKDVASIVGSALLVVCSFFAAQIVVVLAIRLLIELQVMQASDLEKPLPQLIFLAVSYSLALVLVVLMSRLFNDSHKESVQKLLGVIKKPRLADVGLAVLGFGAYLVLTITCSLLIQAIWPGFNADQVQQVGFKDLAVGLEYVLAFTALVVVAPIVEELLFRGYLFGKLRARSNFWISTIVTSALFGAVHLQWNVGVDVFALSLVLCYLRERTGAVWAGIVLHMIKNAVAFTFLFLHPELLKNLL